MALMMHKEVVLKVVMPLRPGEETNGIGCRLNDVSTIHCRGQQTFVFLIRTLIRELCMTEASPGSFFHE